MKGIEKKVTARLYVTRSAFAIFLLEIVICASSADRVAHRDGQLMILL